MFRPLTRPEIDAYRFVGDHAALQRAGLFVAEGRLIVERLLESGRFRIHSVAVTPPAAAALAPVFERRPDVPIHLCDGETLQEITGYDFHRGCLALAWRPPADIPLESVAAATRLLALEEVGNPDNVGGLFRTGFALGVDAVLLSPGTADPLYRKAIRTSMAATLRLQFARVPDWPGGLSPLRERGFRVLALTPHPDALALSDLTIDPADRLIIVAGSEGAGLSEGSLRYADVMVRIPIDPRADSLNVVVATGIVLNALRTEP
jgi:tRNA G18 (ribose-2'-O)-methylase SpoU